MAGKLKTFPAIFIYDKNTIDVLFEFGKPKHNFRTARNVAKELKKTELEIMQIVIDNAALFVASVKDPELLSLTTEI
jgi:hypothetical protein